MRAAILARCYPLVHRVFFKVYKCVVIYAAHHQPLIEDELRVSIGVVRITPNHTKNTGRDPHLATCNWIHAALATSNVRDNSEEKGSGSGQHWFGVFRVVALS